MGTNSPFGAYAKLSTDASGATVLSVGGSEWPQPLLPSGGDDGPAMVAMAAANNGVVMLGIGDFKVESYCEFDIDSMGASSLQFIGAGINATRILIHDDLASSLGTANANWLTATPVFRVWSMGNRVGNRIQGIQFVRTDAVTYEMVAVNDGLCFLFDPPSTAPSVGYTPQEWIHIEDVRFSGWDCAIAKNDCTQMSQNRVQYYFVNYAIATGFNDDTNKFEMCRFGSGYSSQGASNPAHTPFYFNGYSGRPNNVLAYTITAGVGTVTSASVPVLPVSSEFYVLATGGLGNRVITVTGYTAGTSFTFDATGIADTSGNITFGVHAAIGGGNQWHFDTCWFVGINRMFKSPGTTNATLPRGVKFLNCYWEQNGILFENTCGFDIEFDSCYLFGSPWATYATYMPGDSAKQSSAVIYSNSSGSNSAPSRIRFKKCYGQTYADGWVMVGGSEQTETRSHFVEFDDCALAHGDATRAARHYHIASLPNGSVHPAGVAKLNLQYQLAVNANLTNEHNGAGLHRFRGFTRLHSSDRAVYQASSRAASNVPTIPATLIPNPVEYDTFVLDVIDKNVAIDLPKARRVDTTATYDNYTTEHLTVNATTIGRIASHQMAPLRFILKEDGTAGHTITWDAIYKFHTAFTQSVVTTDANKTTMVEFIFDGTNWVQVSNANVWL